MLKLRRWSHLPDSDEAESNIDPPKTVEERTEEKHDPARSPHSSEEDTSSFYEQGRHPILSLFSSEFSSDESSDDSSDISEQTRRSTRKTQNNLSIFKAQNTS